MRFALGLESSWRSFLCACAQSPRASSETPALSGERAMEHVRAQVALGPRPPGSPALQKCREYIKQQMSGFGYQIEDDAFIAQTPYGPITMHNLIARKGKGERASIALASHYDTKLMEGKNFVGANDGGSSTGLLIEFARVLAEKKDASRLLVSVSGWRRSLCGVEHISTALMGAGIWRNAGRNEGMVPKIRALILLDMIGDKDLDIWYETNSTKWLMDLVWETAEKIGLNSILSQTGRLLKTIIFLFLMPGFLLSTSLISTTVPKILIITLRPIRWTKSALKAWKKWAGLCWPCFRNYRNSQNCETVYLLG